MKIDANWRKLMKIDENWRELAKIVANQWKPAKICENVGKPETNPRNSGKFRENPRIPRKSARYCLTGRLFNWMVHFSLQMCLAMGQWSLRVFPGKNTTFHGKLRNQWFSCFPDFRRTFTENCKCGGKIPENCRNNRISGNVLRIPAISY